MIYSFERDGVLYLKKLISDLHISQKEQKHLKIKLKNLDDDFKKLEKEAKHLRIENSPRTISDKKYISKEMQWVGEKYKKYHNNCINIVNELQSYKDFFTVNVYEFADLLIKKLNLKRPVSKDRKYIIRQLKDNEKRTLYFLDYCEKNEWPTDWVTDVRGYSSSRAIFLGKSNYRDFETMYLPYPDLNLVKTTKNSKQPLYSLVGDDFKTEALYILVYEIVKKELWQMVEKNMEKFQDKTKVTVNSELVK